MNMKHIRESLLFLILFSAFALTSCSAGGTESDTAAAPEYNWSAPGFSTDFSRILIDPATILSGGPPKDGIPAVDNPVHQSIEEARTILAPAEQVILVESGGQSIIYPIRILTWHEIANDNIGGTPLAVTFCPLCNTGVVFHREHEGRILDFGTTGRLQGSNLLMYDRQTETWWQQATGEGVIGEFAGNTLDFFPSRSLSFAEAVQAAPDALVLSSQTGYSRPYGSNPYEGYDGEDSRPFLFRGPIDDSRPAMERSIVVKAGGEESLVAYSEVTETGVHSLNVGGEAIVLLFAPEAGSALDTKSIAGRTVGSVNAYSARVRSETADFEQTAPGLFLDSVTGSTWTAAGLAVDGTAAGESLEPVVGIQHFWFSARHFLAE